MKQFLNNYNCIEEKENILSDCVLVNCKDQKYEAGGIPLFSDGNKMKVLNDDTHGAIIGSTGSMKTTRVGFITAISCIRHGESLFIFDPKEEFYPRLKDELYKNGYATYILNFREPMKGNRFNPLTCVQNAKNNEQYDKSNMLIRDIANILFHDLEKYTSDIFWAKKAMEYFSGLAGIIRDFGGPGELTFENIRYLHTLGEKRRGIKRNFEFFLENLDKLSVNYTNLSGTVDSPNQTRESIHSIFTTPLSIFDNEGMKDMMCSSDFELDDLGKQKMAIFLIAPDEKNTYNLLVSMIIKLAYECLISLAYEKYEGVLPVRVNFLLDEFCNLPEIPDFNSMISASRSRNIRFHLFMQSYSQLESKYGKLNAWNVLNNCGIWLLLKSNEYEFNKLVSDSCGMLNMNYARESIPYISPFDIQSLNKPKGELFVIHNCKAYKTTLPFIDEYGFELGHKNYERGEDRKKTYRPHFDIDIWLNKIVVERKLESEELEKQIKFLLEKINRKIENFEKEEQERNENHD